jgi:hypothetical protein
VYSSYGWLILARVMVLYVPNGYGSFLCLVYATSHLELKEVRKRHPNQFSCAYLNINSFGYKFCSVKELLTTNTVDMLIIAAFSYLFQFRKNVIVYICFKFNIYSGSTRNKWLKGCLCSINDDEICCIAKNNDKPWPLLIHITTRKSNQWSDTLCLSASSAFSYMYLSKVSLHWLDFLVVMWINNGHGLSLFFAMQHRFTTTLYNQCLSPPMLWVRIPLRQGVLDTTLCDKVCQWLAASLWFSPGTSVSSTNKSDRHDIAEILLKVKLNPITLTHLN